MNPALGLPNVVININNLNVEEPQEINVEIGSNEVGAKIANSSIKEDGTRVNDKYLQDFKNSSIVPSVTTSKEGKDGDPSNIDLHKHEEKDESKNMSFFVNQLLSKRDTEDRNRKIHRLKEHFLSRTDLDSKLLTFENDVSTRPDSSIPSVPGLPAEFLKLQDIEVDLNQTKNGSPTKLLPTTQMTLIAVNHTNDTTATIHSDALNNTSDSITNDKAIDNSTVKFPDGTDEKFTGIYDNSHGLNMTLDFVDFLPKFKNEDNEVKKPDNFTIHREINDEINDSYVNNLTIRDNQNRDLKVDIGKEENLNLCKNESNNNNLYVASFINCSQASNYIKSSCQADAHMSVLTSHSNDAVALGALKMVKDMFDAIEEVHLDKTSEGWKMKINGHQVDLEHEDVSQGIKRVKNILKRGKNINSIGV